MLEIRLAAKQEIEYVERSVPRARDEWVLVKILSAPMCNEYHQYARGTPIPQIGHEAAGIVEDPARSGTYQAGDRVVVMPQLPCGQCELCRQGEYIHCPCQQDVRQILGPDTATATFAQYMLKPARQLVPVPAGYDLDHAAMVCCGLGPSFGAAERMQIDHSHTVLVSGLGPVGLGAVINCTFRNAAVIGSDPNPYRRELALALGANHVLDPTVDGALEQIMDWTEGRGVDRAMECAGMVTAQEFCVQAAKIKGHITIVGATAEKASIPLGHDILFKGLTIQGSWHYNQGTTAKLMNQIGQVGAQLEQMITHRFPLRNVRDAWETQCEGRCGKVILQPWT